MKTYRVIRTITTCEVAYINASSQEEADLLADGDLDFSKEEIIESSLEVEEDIEEEYGNNCPDSGWIRVK